MNFLKTYWQTSLLCSILQFIIVGGGISPMISLCTKCLEIGIILRVVYRLTASYKRSS